MYALDARTGSLLWKSDEEVFGTWLGYSTEHGILLQAGSASGDRARDEVSRGMVAYRGSDGKVLWKSDDSYKGPPILYHDWVVTQTGGGSGSATAEAKVFNLLTGEYVMRQHPMTGETVPWTWVRFKGCNTAVASENLLTFRSASGAFVDLTGAQGTASLGGFKSGCTSNLIVADGVLNARTTRGPARAAIRTRRRLRWSTCRRWRTGRLTTTAIPASQRRSDRSVSTSVLPATATPKTERCGSNSQASGGRHPIFRSGPNMTIPGGCATHSSRDGGRARTGLPLQVSPGIREVAVRMFIQPGQRSHPSVEAFDKHIDKIPTWSEDQDQGSFRESREPYTVRLHFAEIAGCRSRPAVCSTFRCKAGGYWKVSISPKKQAAQIAPWSRNSRASG